jgi:serine/threonine protein kinase
MMLLPKTIGPLTLQRKLGTGGVSERYLGVTEDGQPVAVRRILPFVRRDANRLASLEARVRDLQGIKHPFLVQVLDWIEYEDERFVVEEWVDGVDLERIISWCRQQGRLIPHNVFLNLATQMCSALEVLHGRPGRGSGAENVLHLGLMPGHVFVTRDARVVVGGYALTRSPTALPQGGMAGPVPTRMEYLSPEQTQPDQKLLPASDVFGLGGILYEALTLEPLFRAESNLQTIHRVRRADVAAPLQKVKQRMPGLDKVLVRALSVNPRHRYQRAFVLREDLRGLMAGYSFASITDDAKEFLAPMFDDDAVRPTSINEPPPEPQHTYLDPTAVPETTQAHIDAALAPLPETAPPPSTETQPVPELEPAHHAWEPTGPVPPPNETTMDHLRGGPEPVEEMLLRSQGNFDHTELTDARQAAGQPGKPWEFEDPPTEVKADPTAVPAKEPADTAAWLAGSAAAFGASQDVPPLDSMDETLVEATLPEETVDDPVQREPVVKSNPTLLPANELPPPEPARPMPPPSNAPPPWEGPSSSLSPHKEPADTAAFAPPPPPPALQPPPPDPELRPTAAAEATSPVPETPAPVAAPPSPSAAFNAPPPVNRPPTEEAFFDEEEPEKSKMPLFLGIAALAVFGCAGLGGAAFWVSSSKTITDPVVELDLPDENPLALAGEGDLDDEENDAIADLLDEGDDLDGLDGPAEDVDDVDDVEDEPVVADVADDIEDDWEPAVAPPVKPRPESTYNSTTTSGSGSYSSGSVGGGYDYDPGPSALLEPDLDLEEDSYLEAEEPEATNVEMYASDARDGTLGSSDVMRLELVETSDASYTRSRTLLLMNAEASGDRRATSKYLDELFELPENTYNAVFLAKKANLAVNDGRYQTALDTSKKAERYWGRIPPELVFATKSDIYEVQAASYQGLFYADPDDLELLESAILGWEKYKRHVMTKGQAGNAEKADRQIAKLEDTRERLQ